MTKKTKEPTDPCPNSLGVLKVFWGLSKSGPSKYVYVTEVPSLGIGTPGPTVAAALRNLADILERRPDLNDPCCHLNCSHGDVIEILLTATVRQLLTASGVSVIGELSQDPNQAKVVERLSTPVGQAILALLTLDLASMHDFLHDTGISLELADKGKKVILTIERGTSTVSCTYVTGVTQIATSMQYAEGDPLITAVILFPEDSPRGKQFLSALLAIEGKRAKAAEPAEPVQIRARPLEDVIDQFSEEAAASWRKLSLNPCSEELAAVGERHVAPLLSVIAGFVRWMTREGHHSGELGTNPWYAFAVSFCSRYGMQADDFMTFGMKEVDDWAAVQAQPVEGTCFPARGSGVNN